MKDFLILGGGGMQGKIVARDLLESGRTVFLADLYPEGAQRIIDRFPGTPVKKIDLRNVNEITALIKEVDPAVVVNCAEGDWNLNVYEACLRTKKHVIDLGSDIPITKEQIAMDKDFKEAGIIGITGCGSTPGINNVMLHHAHQMFDSLENVDVGFAWNSNIEKFVVPFSIPSIIEEFTDPAPYIENDVWKEAIPQDTLVDMEFREIGKQKCFLVRHPETYTFYLRNRPDGLKNIKFYAGFPEHSYKTIKMFIDCGLASKKPIKIEGGEVLPINVLTQSLRTIEPPEGYTEKENLWVKVSGIRNGKPDQIHMECIVNTLPGWEDAGCNIDTGMPASIIAQMVKDGVITERGSFPPGPVVPSQLFFSELRKRKMDVYCNNELIN
ncbi:MAG: saccharopine dehydrogenase C-terminal domain-containing protein [Patescibacteria group bacterium]